MQYYHLLPFEKIPPNSKLVLYGAGEVGQWYLQQLKLTKYATVVAIADQQYDKYSSMGIPLIKPEKISETDFDFVLISIDNVDVAQDVANMLSHKMNVEKEKILLGSESLCIVPRFLKPDVDFVRAYETRGIAIAVCLSGGLGDCIIYKRKIDEILKWDSRIIIDCFVTDPMLVPMHSFFDHEYDGRVNAIIGGGEDRYSNEKENYAIAMHLSTDLDVDAINEDKFRLAPSLLSKCLKIRDQSRAYGNTDHAMRYVHYMRCKKDGLNCYQSFNRYDGFDVQDFHTNIPLNQFWKNKFISLHLPKRYITVNCGFDGTMKHPINKAWPLKYFSAFTKLFHERFPGVSIIQVSGKAFPEIEGVDHAFIGKNLELVKYILKGSFFHLDIEGGLVHLASQLGTRCIVLFGPTHLQYYAYKGNVNIQAGDCQECCWMIEDIRRCYRKLAEPECMYKITPEIVMDNVEKYFGETLQKF